MSILLDTWSFSYAQQAQYNMWNDKIKSKHGNNPKHISVTEIETIVISALFPEEAVSLE